MDNSTKTPNSTKTVKRQRRDYGLTKLQDKFAHLLAQDMKVSEAAREAGFSEGTINSTAYKIARQLAEKGIIDDIRERNQAIAAGLGKDAIARVKKFVDLTDAKKVVTATEKGKITDEKVYDDGQLQLAAAKELSKLCGDYPSEELEITDKRPVRVITSLSDPLADAIDVSPVKERPE